MKNQYFGDINDYRKYGLLRSIILTTEFRILVAWVLTPDDDRTDGKFVGYLEKQDKWSSYDTELFEALKNLLRTNQVRQVALLESTGLLPEAKYFNALVPDKDDERGAWFSSLCECAQDCDFVFLDPDNGLEIKSRPYGRKDSSKYSYLREVKGLWSQGKSLLIYQHFVREKRTGFIKRKLETLKEATPDSLVVAFSTPNVVFLMALQPAHKKLNPAIVEHVMENWSDQIQHWEC
jgi:uncharacterized protein YcgL (UPF0745 family)